METKADVILPIASSARFATNRKQVRELFIKLLILLLSALAAITVLTVELPKNPYSYLHGFSLKNKLLRTSAGPKLVLVGDSGLAFGIDSDALKSDLNMNVVNLGLHGGLGMDFMLNWAGTYLSNGDVAVVSFSYSMYSGNAAQGDATICELLLEEPSAWRYVDTQYTKTLFEGMGSVCGDRLLVCLCHSHYTSNEVYNAHAFNECGDVVSHLDKENPDQIPANQLPAKFNKHALTRLSGFVTFAEAKGVRVYILPPCYRSQEFALNFHEVESIYSDIKRVFPNEAISDPSNFVYDGKTFFFDTEYHLNKAGREKRTSQLIHLLKAKGL